MRGRNTLYAPVDNNRNNNNNICRSVGPDKRARLDRSAEIESYSRESLLIENPVNRRAVCGSEQPVRKIGTLSSVAIVRSAHCVPICVCRTDRTGLAAAGDGAQGHHRRCRKCLGPAPVEPTNNNGQKRAPTSFVYAGHDWDDHLNEHAVVGSVVDGNGEDDEEGARAAKWYPKTSSVRHEQQVMQRIGPNANDRARPHRPAESGRGSGSGPGFFFLATRRHPKPLRVGGGTNATAHTVSAAQNQFFVYGGDGDDDDDDDDIMIYASTRRVIGGRGAGPVSAPGRFRREQQLQVSDLLGGHRRPSPSRRLQLITRNDGGDTRARAAQISAFTINVYTVTTEQQAAAAEYVWCILRPNRARARAYARTHAHARVGRQRLWSHCVRLRVRVSYVFACVRVCVCVCVCTARTTTAAAAAPTMGRAPEQQQPTPPPPSPVVSDSAVIVYSRGRARVRVRAMAATPTTRIIVVGRLRRAPAG
ncbi:Uncharacterized protein FWK35_00024145 [Aphis craccivora]|uniref:Uncharacterized protein n=1 Tax=Aphis craccivora TaxID=307492 RepID=A0A6G0Z1U6_APHCR|nr:Uncharacterized protein FWK35_00024145 [Aphis craccivora]